MAGLDAPKEIGNFYEYGRQRIIFHAARWAKYKRKIPVPYVHDVPQIEYSLFKPYEPIEKLEFDANEIYNWDCLYNEPLKLDTPDCPSMDEVLALRQRNSVLWQRFLSLGDYKTFSMPDHFIDRTYSAQNIMKLARLHAVHLLDIQAKGYSEKAMEEWVRYMTIYKQMVHNHSTMVGKAIFLILFKTHMNALESLIYNDPQLAVTHNDAIRKAIYIDSVLQFQAGQLIADDWRIISPSFLPTMGMTSHHKKELLSCFNQNQKLAELPAAEYFNQENIRICEAEFRSDFTKQIRDSFLEPGFFVTNLVFGLLIGGVIKGEELIGSMHRNIADIQMANAGIELIRQNIQPQDVQTQLNNMSKNLWNPITEEPFLWDESNGWIYYPNPEDPSLEASRVFRVNLTGNP